jgi:hypothetical protein
MQTVYEKQLEAAYLNPSEVNKTFVEEVNRLIWLACHHSTFSTNAALRGRSVNRALRENIACAVKRYATLD